MKELAALAYRDTTSENREYWKSEMGQALREIQQSYDDKVDGIRAELESFYNLKVRFLLNRIELSFHCDRQTFTNGLQTIALFIIQSRYNEIIGANVLLDFPSELMIV